MVIEHFNSALKHLRIADHMAYVTYPLINDKKILIKIFVEVYGALNDLITAILLYDAAVNNLKLSKSPKANAQRFFEIAKTYNITAKEVQDISEIMKTFQDYNKSAMEFVRDDKFVIMSKDLKTHSMDILKIKEDICLIKVVIVKVKDRILSKRSI
jgi:hypothetical protein